jgi:hypothetical protein
MEVTMRWPALIWRLGTILGMALSPALHGHHLRAPLPRRVAEAGRDEALFRRLRSRNLTAPPAPLAYMS